MNSREMLAKEFVTIHPDESARVLQGFSVEAIVAFVQSLSALQAAEVIRRLPLGRAAGCLAMLHAETGAEIAGRLPVQVAAALVRRCPEPTRRDLLANLKPDVRRHLQTVLDFPESSAAAIMDPHVFTLFADLTADEALQEAKRQAGQLSHQIPVLDRQQRLQGSVTLQRLMQAKRRDVLSGLLDRTIGLVGPGAHLKRVLTHPLWAVHRELFVVDEDGIFLGIIRSETTTDLAATDEADAGAGQALATGQALGELFWLGLTALFSGQVGADKGDAPGQR